MARMHFLNDHLGRGFWGIYLLYYMFELFQISSAWGIGLIIGPALGGFLAQVFSFA